MPSLHTLQLCKNKAMKYCHLFLVALFEVNAIVRGLNCIVKNT